MHFRTPRIASLFYPLVLFCLALAIRLHFFSGFILCDDVEFFQLSHYIYSGGLNFQGVLQYRFLVWLPHFVSFLLLGVSETAFMLPLWLFSASLSPLAYFVMRSWQYPLPAALLAGLVVATAPFEVLIGTVVSNDLTLEWLMALALLAWARWESRPGRLGLAWAVLFWLGFYTKIWVVYWLPLIGFYFIRRLRHQTDRQGPWAFCGASFVLHGLTVLFWKWKMGMFFPFLTAHSATYPVPANELGFLFRQYPGYLFEGSQFGTTLFGWIPYLWILLFAARLAANVLPALRRRSGGLDRNDWALAALAGLFFLMINFFPNAFRFDQYYSMPRIFRYLAPLSWPMALHAVKMAWDLSRLPGGRWSPAWPAVFCLALLPLNWAQAVDATRPGRIQYSIQQKMVEDLRQLCPPKILLESWQSFFLQHLYLSDSCAGKAFVPLVGIYQAPEHEAWLNENQPQLPTGTVLVSGIGSCVHYSCYGCGFRLVHFNQPLGPAWKMIREYESLSYLPDPEPVRLWQLESSSAEVPAPAAPEPEPEPAYPGGVQEAFDLGMKALEAGLHAEARRHFGFITTRMPESALAEDAFYFHGVTFWREADFPGTIGEFQKLLDRFPKGRQAPGAHYHIAMACREMGKTEEARRHFQVILDHFPQDTTTRQLARQQIDLLPALPLWERLKALFR